MNRGYIRVWRKIEDSGILENPEVCRLFLYLLLRAASRPVRRMTGNIPVCLEPGQAIVGRKMLASKLCTTEGKIRTGLAALRKMGVISQRSTNRFTVISIINWSRYQNGPDSGNRPPATGQPADSQRTSSAQPAADPMEDPAIPLPQQGKTGGARQRRNRQASRNFPENPGTGQNSATNKNKENKKKEDKKKEGGNGDMAGRGPVSGSAGRAREASSVPGEFLELRAWYDGHARAEAPRTGLDEYRECRESPDWPGLAAVLGAAALLAERDGQWQRGFAPGLTRFLRERQWLKKPVPARLPDRGGTAAGAACATGVPGIDSTIIANLSTAERVLAKRQGGTP